MVWEIRYFWPVFLFCKERQDHGVTCIVLCGVTPQMTMFLTLTTERTSHFILKCFCECSCMWGVRFSHQYLRRLFLGVITLCHVVNSCWCLVECRTSEILDTGWHSVRHNVQKKLESLFFYVLTVTNLTLRKFEIYGECMYCSKVCTNVGH